MRREMRIYTAIISHKHGYTVLAGRTIRAINKKVAKYCRDWWGENGTTGTVPKDDYDVIEQYFNIDGNEWIESCETTV
jgi:hypothetical protein